MTQVRYERLDTNGNDPNDDHPSGINIRTSYSNRFGRNDDDNEEIELDIDNSLKSHTRHSHQRNQQQQNQLDEDNLHDLDDVYLLNDNRTNSLDNIHHDSEQSGNSRHPVGGTSYVHGSHLMQMAIGTLATILLYLTLSICLTFYQKALIKKLKFPLSIVSYHLVIKFILAASVRTVYKWRMGKTRVQLDCRTALRKMAPTGIASGIDIGFSNWGLELVPISLYTMTKSSTIVFILFFAILLGLEKKSWSLVFIVGLIATGLFMFTYKSTQFDALGFIFILVASLSSGVRWSFAQFVMQKSKLGLHNPVDMIYHMQPWMIASLLPFLVAFEGQKLYDILRDLSEVSNDTILMIMFKITFGAILAFLMEISEFLVLSQTSSLTLSIAGIFKDICQLALAVFLYGDQLSVMNVFGLIVCLAGICCHLIHKYATLAKLEEINGFDEDLQFNETNINANGGLNAHHHNHATANLQKKNSAQTPLLNETDSDNSNNDGNDANASDVIFDVLKRRDMQR